MDLRYEQGEPLMKLIEECSEVIHAASKIIRFGELQTWPGRPDRSNVEELMMEIKDLLHAVHTVLELVETKYPDGPPTPTIVQPKELP